jgi:hypothetical protein
VIGAAEFARSVGGLPHEAAPERPPQAVVDGLLTDPGRMLEEAQAADAATQARAVRVLLLAILGGTAAFGAAVGFYRGGLQMLYAAIKLPLVVLLTAAVATPVLTALGVALGREARLRTDLLRVLAALARGCLMLAALAPLMLVASCVRLGYHQAVLLLVVCCIGAGGAGLPLLLRGLWAEKRGRVFLIAAMLVVVTMAGTHTAWLFRPYLVRPRTTEVPFLRALDGSFSDSVGRSQRSARGIYDEVGP